MHNEKSRSSIELRSLPQTTTKIAQYVGHPTDGISSRVVVFNFLMQRPICKRM